MAGRSKDVNIDTRTDIQTLRHKDTQIRWLTLDHTDNTETRTLVVCFCDKGEAYCQHAEWGAFIVCVRVCLRPCRVWVSMYLCLGALSVFMLCGNCYVCLCVVCEFVCLCDSVSTCCLCDCASMCCLCVCVSVCLCVCKCVHTCEALVVIAFHNLMLVSNSISINNKKLD